MESFCNIKSYSVFPDVGLASGRSTSLLHSSPVLTFPSGVGLVAWLSAGASKGEGGECLARKRCLRCSCNRTDSLVGVRSKEGTTKMPHNRRLGEVPDDGEGRDEGED